MNRLIGSVVVLCCATVFAAELSAAEISKRAREQGALNLTGLKAELKLTTTNPKGEVKEQVLTTASKKIDGKNHSLSRFSAPAGVAGVAVLTIEGGADGDDISLFLPKLKRVRKVAKGERNKSFMDTDFAWNDLSSNGARDENVKKKADEKVEGRPCFVLEGKADDDSAYGLVTMWVDQQTFVPMKVEYQDKDGKPFKRFRTLKLKAYQQRVLAGDSIMENLKAGSKTQATVLKLEDAPAGDDAYTERALERG